MSYQKITMYAGMTNSELRAFINGCHSAREYDSYFESACAELNSRLDPQSHLETLTEAKKHNIQSYLDAHKKLTSRYK